MHSQEEKQNLEIARRYVDVYNGITSGVGNIAEEFFAEDFEWQEMPNIFRPKGRSGGVETVLKAVERENNRLAGELFTIRHAMASGDKIVLEIEWEATSTYEKGKFPPGTKLTANAVLIFIFKNGKIIQERDYFCFATPEI